MGVDNGLNRTTRRNPPRRRVPTRRQKMRRRFWPSVKIVVLGVLVVVIGNVVASKILRPFKLYNREYRETRQLAEHIADMKKENDMLERRIKYIQTPEGAAQAARKQGYVKPGEITLVLPAEAYKTQPKTED